MDDEARQKLASTITRTLPTPDAIAQDWGEFIIDTVLEGVWARGVLSQRERSLITIAALTVLYRPHELKIHLGRAMDNGLTEEELSEAIMHLAIYGGFPTSVEGMRTAKEVFDERA